METLETLKRIQSRLTGIIESIPDDEREYFTRWLESIEARIEWVTVMTENNAAAQQLISLWEEHITPITGVRATKAFFEDDHYWFCVTLDTSDENNIKMGSSIQEAISVIVNKNTNLLKWTK